MVTEDAAPPPQRSGGPVIDTSVPHSARIWNFWLGGKDYYEADRVMGERILAHFPEIVENARANRYFLCRAVRYLVGTAGIRQFLDIGTGLPTVDNTHEIAQRLAPECRIVYVDNDPLVLAHARALLTSTAEGATDYLDADVRDTDAILARAARTLDLSRPVALMMLGVMQFVEEDGEAYATVARLLQALAPGSHLVLSHPSNALRGERMEEGVRQWNAGGGSPRIVLRTQAEISGLFTGLELLEPGVGSTGLWRPDLHDSGPPYAGDDFGGVARKV
ncbi:SAM-dependent methyltransferase [Streptomyces litchfieldiae]|uniref:SAM-dependent methyltransferase n=1 Tax=Streptomyces litchfieldiae TaxID=3075543 RepID=A0ABU2MRU0_9ACTN|nr:SAM-dependent methyltransferase [Streptomyces sp. DSM 44938]MDT0344344.1 SAM-dependent methyltransferase [Streptomyces sp. DSM 44938]